MANFSHCRAVVTGASSGIGRAIAVSLARRGAEKILIHYRSNVAGAEKTAALAREIGSEVVMAPADICDPDSVGEFVETAWQELGYVSTWINNAGADVLTGENAALSFEEKLRLLMETDVLGTIAMSRIVSERLTSQPPLGENHSDSPPSMTFIGWDQAFEGMEGDAGQMFGTVKAAVMAYANSLAQTLAPRVRVNLIAPGWIKTAWGESTSQYWNQRAASQSLMGRWGTPEDVAKAVCFVADPANTFCTGQTLAVNGGWSRRPNHLDQK